MRVALALTAVLMLAAAVPARAENWVHTRDSGSGLPMCFDKDSVRPGADGLTHYNVKMCQDAGYQVYAVDCTKNFKVELLIRVYEQGDSGRSREFTIDDLNSGMAVDAIMACKK